MHIYCENQQTSIPILLDQVKALVKESLSFEKVDTDEIGIYFVSKERICELHEQFFSDPSPTDCISLPIDQDKKTDSTHYHVLGEIFVCPATAQKYISEHGGTLDLEISLYIVHGLLHLAGYDDLQEDKCQEMRGAEQRHLRNLKKKELLLKLC